jgi:sortase A
MTRVGLTRLAERLTWTLAAVTLGAWVFLRVDARVSARQEIDRFAAARSAGSASTPDFTLWSAHAIEAWRASRTAKAPLPLGVLKIPRLRLEAPVLEGTADATLDRGLGHIEDTATLGSTGNVGVAGHRDSFFRVLKDIAVGDTIDVETLEGSASYRVERTWLVQPEDVWVLDPTPSPALTLVTCYPFYYNGAAPQRFIVRAVRASGQDGRDPLDRLTGSTTR